MDTVSQWRLTSFGVVTQLTAGLRVLRTTGARRWIFGNGLLLLVWASFVASSAASAAEIIAPGTGWHFNHAPPFVPSKIRGYPATQAAIDGLSQQLKTYSGCPNPELLVRIETPYSWNIYPIDGGMQAWCYYQNGNSYPGNSSKFAAECPGNTVSPVASLSSPSFVACRYFTGTVLSKNAGPPPSCGVGNPVNPGTGNKWQHEVDYVGSGAYPLKFARDYNSGLQSNASLGMQWRSIFDRRLSVSTNSASPFVGAFRADGRSFTFKLVGSVWTPDADIADRLIQLTDASGNTTGWTYTHAATDESESYDANGRLIATTNRAGLSQTLSYDAVERLTSVTDPFGRQLSFTYDASNRIAAMIDPAGGVYTYSYNSINNLSTVTTPDGKTRTYVYNESANTSGANLPYVLTGIVDENGDRFATYKYNSTGKAISSEHASGTEKVTLSYNSNGTTTVTDALGTVRSYGFQTILGVVKNTSISQPCTGCGGTAASTTYDVNGNVASRSDFNGNRTNYTYDLTRNLETERVEALTSTGGTTTQTRTITTQWHPLYRLPTQITEPGRVTTFSYDPNGNLLSKTITAGTKTRTWTYTYTSLGQVLSADGPRTDVADLTTHAYDAQGNLATITNALGHVTRITQYDAHGHPLSLQDPNGVITTLAYDLRGRLITRTVGTEITSYEYDGVGQLTEVSLPTGAVLSYTYDAAHRLTDIQDNLGNKIHYTLDLMGNRTQEDILDPQGTLRQTHARAYNGLNRLIKDIGAAGQTTQYGYDNNGNLTTITDPLNQVTTNTYDKLNRLIEVQDPLNGHTQTQYDPLDQITRILDPLGSATDYTIDGLGDTEETESPDTGITQRSFDAAGNVLTETDARGKTTTHQYDALNRLTQTTFDDGAEITYTYDTGTDNRGRLMDLTDPNGSTAWSYDGQGRVTQRRQQLDGIQLTLNYSYDTQGRLTQITYPSGRILSLGYDAAGRGSSLQADGQTIVNQITYHPFGLPTGWTWGNGTPYTRSLDLDGRLSAYPLGGVTHSVSYDPASRITEISGSETKAYGYDALDRLTSVTAPGITQTYSYDPNGNRLTEKQGRQATSYSYALGSNRLESRTQGTTQSYSYDPAGNLTDDGAHAFTYDDRGRMVQAITGALTTLYRYNGLGERVSKTAPGSSAVSRRFVYDEAGHLIGEYDGAGAPLQETVYLGDLPIAVLSGTDGIHYVHADQINTPRVITDSQGVVVWRWESNPFGVGTPDQDPDGDGLGFIYNLRMPGQYFDAETGLHYNYYRDYDPSLGRYVQSDPVGLQGGLNTYGYVGNNPLSYTDPYGLWTWPSPSDVWNYWGEFSGGSGDFYHNWQDMRQARWIGGDKYFHCKANCEAAQRGPGGADAACVIGDTREWWDQYIKSLYDPRFTPEDSAADQIANRYGRGQGSINRGTSCEELCAPFRPAGLPSQY